MSNVSNSSTLVKPANIGDSIINSSSTKNPPINNSQVIPTNKVAVNNPSTNTPKITVSGKPKRARREIGPKNIGNDTLSNITNKNKETIKSFTEKIEEQLKKKNSIIVEVQGFSDSIDDIIEALGDEKFNNILNNSNIDSIIEYLRNSFNKMENNITLFNTNIKNLDKIETIKNSKEEIEGLLKNINDFIDNPQFMEGQVKSTSKVRYIGVIDANMSQSVNSLIKLIKFYDDLQEQCNGIKNESTIEFNKTILENKKVLKLNVIKYFNEQILGLKYKEYEELNIIFKEQLSPEFTNTKKLETLVIMRNLIITIKDDFTKFKQIFNKNYKYSNSNIYDMNNNSNINSSKTEISNKITEFENELNKTIADYKRTTELKMTNLKNELQKILLSISTPIKAYNPTAGNNFSITFNEDCLDDINKKIQTRIKTILDNIDSKLGSMGSKKNVSNIASPFPINSTQNFEDAANEEDEQKLNPPKTFAVGDKVEWSVSGNIVPGWTVEGVGSGGTAYGTINEINNINGTYKIKNAFKMSDNNNLTLINIGSISVNKKLLSKQILNKNNNKFNFKNIHSNQGSNEESKKMINNPMLKQPNLSQVNLTSVESSNTKQSILNQVKPFEEGKNFTNKNTIGKSIGEKLSNPEPGTPVMWYSYAGTDAGHFKKAILGEYNNSKKKYKVTNIKKLNDKPVTHGEQVEVSLETLRKYNNSLNAFKKNI